jgi:hypothetical protein
MEGPQPVGPALRDQEAIGGAHLRPEQGVIDPALRRVNVEIGRHDVEVAGENGRRAAVQEAFGVARQPFEPAQLVIESGRRSPLRCSGCACRRDRPASRGGSPPARLPGRQSPLRSSFSARARPRRSRRPGSPPPEICRRAPSAPGGRLYPARPLAATSSGWPPPVDAVDVVGRDPHRIVQPNSQVATCRLGDKTYATATLIHNLTFIFGLKPTWCRTD